MTKSEKEIIKYCKKRIKEAKVFGSYYEKIIKAIYDHSARNKTTALKKDTPPPSKEVCKI